VFTRAQIKRRLTALAMIATVGFPPAALAMPVEAGGASVPVTPPVTVTHASQTALGPTDASAGGYAVVPSAVRQTVVGPTDASSGGYGVSAVRHTALGPTDASSGGYDFAPSALPATAQPGSGFQWDDAGIGAAGMVALIGAGAAASVSIRRRRVRQIVTS
jgi:hypothetical protein